MRIQAWCVHDTGLVAVPGPFRRLAGAVRHHQSRGQPWPAAVTLEVGGDHLVVEGVGAWPLSDVSVRIVGQGPPVTFVLHVADGDQLLAAAADETTAALLAAIGD